MPTASERRLAVLGFPIAHSRSPALHLAAYRVLGLPWRYERAEVTGDTLTGYLAGRDSSWRGLSLTMPLKQTVLPLVATLDAVARRTGAANTVLFDEQDGERLLRGFNTDVAGIVRALGAAGLNRARVVQVLGGGATAASAVVAAAELGAERVVVAVRSPARAATLVPLAHTVGLVIDVRSFGKNAVDPDADLVVSTLPGGADVPLAFSREVRSRALLLDAAYDPWPSRLATDWNEEGGRVLSGLAMLVHQALLQVRIFVSGDPSEPLPNESTVLNAMLASVGLEGPGNPS